MNKFISTTKIRDKDTKFIIEELERENKFLVLTLENTKNSSIWKFGLLIKRFSFLTRVLKFLLKLSGGEALAKRRKYVYENEDRVNYLYPDSTKSIIELSQISTARDYLVIVPKEYGRNWRGINESTKNLFPKEHILSIPDTLTFGNMDAIVRSIKKNNSIKKVIFSGFPESYTYLLKQLVKRTGVLCLLLYHGSLTQNATEVHGKVINQIIHKFRKGYFHKIGFVKKGLDIFFNSVGVRSEYISNRIRIDSLNISKNKKMEKNNLNIGIFVSQDFNKNLQNQIAAAHMLHGSTIHIQDNSLVDHIYQQDRFKLHPLEDNDKFVKLLGSMDINLYVTLTECFPMYPLESLSQGVPCLVSNNSELFDDNKILHDYLVVDEYDNPTAIYEAIVRVKENYSKIVEEIPSYLMSLHEKSQNSLLKFLND